jgi:hypothetical protein
MLASRHSAQTAAVDSDSSLPPLEQLAGPAELNAPEDADRYSQVGVEVSDGHHYFGLDDCPEARQRRSRNCQNRRPVSVREAD